MSGILLGIEIALGFAIGFVILWVLVANAKPILKFVAVIAAGGALVLVFELSPPVGVTLVLIGLGVYTWKNRGQLQLREVLPSRDVAVIWTLSLLALWAIWAALFRK